jgi:hypothetical protein
MIRTISLSGIKTRFPTRTARNCFAFMSRIVVNFDTASLREASSIEFK